ncbi:MAG TPA: phosphoribosylanthranilate isomerase [Pirellulales bacterium]|jgi:phosphoribosylanthranilate isomerase|nr:phosphoribosylanthranilate isomerase [Pirellulales bacterium]
MFRVKICGITSVADARMVAAAGADAVGLNFFPGSPRFIELERAREIVAVLPPQVRKVGLFVNAPRDQIETYGAQLALDLIQLHGDEPREWLRGLSRPVVKAFRIGATGLSAIDAWLRGSSAGEPPNDPRPIGYLLDAFKAGQYGGTGRALDWKNLTAERAARTRNTPPQPAGAPEPAWILSGGLHSSNVAEAILSFKPDGVDTASGVESAPGQKDPTLVLAFVAAARAALAAVHGTAGAAPPRQLGD